MDLPDVKPGTTILLPVHVSGARLFLGDCHATQGDGELCGVAIEFATETTISVEVRKNQMISWPRLEGESWIMSIGSSRPMEEAVKIGFKDLIDWMASDFGYDPMEAYFVLTQIANVRVGNIVDPNFTVGVSISKDYLK
jgi:acetamidase/formamidase